MLTTIQQDQLAEAQATNRLLAQIIELLTPKDAQPPSIAEPPTEPDTKRLEWGTLAYRLDALKKEIIGVNYFTNLKELLTRLVDVIEELEKRPAVIISPFITPAPLPLGGTVPYVPPFQPYIAPLPTVPSWPNDRTVICKSDTLQSTPPIQAFNESIPDATGTSEAQKREKLGLS